MSVSFTSPANDACRIDPWAGPTVNAGAFTFAARVLITDLTTQHSLWASQVSGGALPALTYDPGAAQWSALLINSTFSSFNPLNGVSAPSINTWYHLAYTYDGASTRRLYINGAISNSDTVAPPTGYSGTWGNFYSPGGLGNMNGAMQDVVAYSAALGAGEVLQLYRERLPVRRTNLIVHLPMRTLTGGNINESGQPTGAFTFDGSPTAGPHTAQAPWGTRTPQVAFRIVSTPVTATATELDSATMTAAAAASATENDSASMTAGASMTATGRLSAAMVATAAMGGTALDSASMAASAAMAATENETGQLTAAAAMSATEKLSGTWMNSGVVPGPTGPYGYVHSMRRPPNNGNRRGLR